jgi:2-oxoglutarate dehydrogenase E1 component
MALSETMNIDVIDRHYALWRQDPAAVAADWRRFFEGFELGVTRLGPAAPGAETCSEEQVRKQSRVDALIYAYRDLGHLLACLDPLVACPTEHPLLSLEAFGLSTADLDTLFYTGPLGGEDRQAPLREIVQALRTTYCRSIGVEYMHLQDPAERTWLQARMEPDRNNPQLSSATRLKILRKLFQAGLFEAFLHKKYLGQTRFSLEGAEGVIPLFDSLVSRAVAGGCREIILGTAHRGRLNIQAHILGKPYFEIFNEFENCYNPDEIVGAGDVKYHNGYLADLETADGGSLRMVLINNPSHLESVDPVVEGFARARQDLAGADAGARVLPVLVHGDSAFAGQGVVMETLNLSQLEGYRTGGTVHLVINNQIGYTTLPEDARSTRYSTDIAKMLMVPVFHVHGENPEALVHVARLACDYRRTFGKDVVLDLVCFRRYGHNEGDEPYFTQPQMYDRIRERPPLHRLYADQLQEAGLVDAETLTRFEAEINGELAEAYEEAHGQSCALPEQRFYENWKGYHGRWDPAPFKSGVARKTLEQLARGLQELPEGFHINPKLERLLKKRLEAVENGSGIDWANAESLAFASLVVQGHPVRLSGQDSRRGTFSQRHCSLVDIHNGRRHVPLARLAADQAPFEAFDSMLSEVGVLGFEYGYAIARPEGLVIWEAQFGDFANNAQSVIDLYIASGEAKWQRLSGLVLLLPHGLEGLGPEHSSARLERFLQLCAGDNLQVCNPTTPAQYFHLLRRQALRPVRKPLVVMAPKSLLRHPLAVSGLGELSGGGFQEVLGDPESPKAPRKTLFCSGKLYYELAQRRGDLEKTDIALIRLEQLHPYPEAQLAALIKKYRRCQEWCWVQEEPANMGAWSFVRPRLEAAIGGALRYIGRDAAASPATGYPHIYRRDQAAIVSSAVGPAPTNGRASVS